MAALLRERVKVVYTIGSAAEKIERQLEGVVKIVQAGTLEAAVKRAAQGRRLRRHGSAGAGLFELRPV